MTHSEPPPKRPQAEPPAGSHGRARAALVVEGMALMIALVTPITPSKTGSKWRPGSLLSEDPTYLLDVLASFLMVNALILVIGVAVWITAKSSGSK
mgnify:CR=1 FL=1